MTTIKSIKRICNYELRMLENGKDYEMIRWYESIDSYCIAIAFFRRHKEGYDMESVGDRYQNALEYDPNIIKALTRYAFTISNAEFNLEESLEIS